VVGVEKSFYIGVDLGGTKLAVGVFDSDLQTLYTDSQPVEHTSDRLLDQIQQAVLTAADSVEGAVVAAGFGVPCLIDQSSGVAVSAVNLPIHDLPFRDIMQERLNLPVAVDNDGNVAALAEQRSGAAKGFNDVVLLTVGTGIGGGLVLNGEIYRGSIGAGAELGHIVIDYNGPKCQGSCPNYGCMEVLASGTALAKLAHDTVEREPSSQLARAAVNGSELNGRLVVELASSGDQLSIDLLKTLGMRLGVGMSSLVNIFNPDVVVIGGGVSAAGELLIDPARLEMQRRALSPSRDTVKVELAHYGAEAGMVGAAVLAIDTCGG